MSAWTVCQVADEPHLVDESAETACGTRGPAFRIPNVTTVTIACSRCREALGDLRRGSPSYREIRLRLCHRLEPILRVNKEIVSATRATWALRCDRWRGIVFEGSMVDVGPTTCLACLGAEGVS